MKVTVRIAGPNIEIVKDDSGAVIAVLPAGSEKYIVDNLADTANLVAAPDERIDFAAWLAQNLPEIDARMMAAMQVPDPR